MQSCAKYIAHGYLILFHSLCDPMRTEVMKCYGSVQKTVHHFVHNVSCLLFTQYQGASWSCMKSGETTTTASVGVPREEEAEVAGDNEKDGGCTARANSSS